MTRRASPYGRPQQETQPLRRVQTVPLGGVEGRIDHLAADPKRGRLFVAALSRLCLAVPHRGAQSAEIRIYDTAPQG